MYSNYTCYMIYFYIIISNYTYLVTYFKFFLLDTMNITHKTLVLFLKKIPKK